MFSLLGLWLLGYKYSKYGHNKIDQAFNSRENKHTSVKLNINGNGGEFAQFKTIYKLLYENQQSIGDINIGQYANSGYFLLATSGGKKNIIAKAESIIGSCGVVTSQGKHFPFWKNVSDSSKMCSKLEESYTYQDFIRNIDQNRNVSHDSIQGLTGFVHFLNFASYQTSTP